jgi:outer membrane protein assembly factor BamB
MIRGVTKARRHKGAKIFFRLCYTATLCLCALTFISCASLKFPQEVADSSGAWWMYGKDASHGSLEETGSDSLAKIWDNDVGAGFGPFSPAIADGIVYVGTLNGQIHALEVSSGKELGSKNFGGAIFSGPVISDSLMVVASSQSKANLFAYDIHSGKTIWSKQIPDVESSPTVYKGKVFVCTVDGDLYKIDLLSGEEIFHETFRGAIRSSPAVDDSLCVFGCDDGNVYAANAASGKEKWKYNAGSFVWCSPSMDDSTVFIGTNGGKLLALDREGKLKFDFTTGEKILSMPISDGKRVYFGCDDGNLYALDIKDGALVWKVHTDAPIVASASQTSTQIFFGGYDKNLYVIDKSDSKVEQKINLPGRIRTQPVIYRNYLVIGAEDSEVYGFEIK